MSLMRLAFASLAFAIGACGAEPAAPQAQKSAVAAAADPDALARAAIAAAKLPDPGGTNAKALADAVRALPPWAPLYPGARIGLDSRAEREGVVQVGFTTADPPEKVAAFYLEAFKRRGPPTDLPEPGMRTIEVSNASGTQITTAVIQQSETSGSSVTLRHEGGGY